MSYTNASNNGIIYDLESYSIDSAKIDYDQLQDKLYSNTQKVYSCMKRYNDDSFDTKKDYICINGYLNGKKYSYYTNRVEELIGTLGIVKEDLDDIN